jgi:hypothetical protein
MEAAMVSPQYERRKAPDFNPSVMCARCDAPMKIKTTTPVISFAPLDEVVYVCPACRIEMKQTVLRIKSE